jgi:hypothetical protein
MATLAEIRAKLKEQESRGSGDNKTGGDNSIYPFWNLKEGQEATVRFLPDGNTDNTFFWVERAMIKLPFAGIKGEAESKNVIVQVPCMEMYGPGNVCPILSEVRPWFKDPNLEDMGKKYWKKKSYIFQGFVVDDPMKEEKPENPIRRFIIGPQIFQLIRAALLDPDMDDLPTDYVHGVDFRIAKTSKGGYADYSTSKWARRERPLDEVELSAINDRGLFNLNEYLPKKPTDVELKVIKEMFEASVDGEAFDMERWGQYYKPAGVTSNTGDPVATKSAPTTSAKTSEDLDDDVDYQSSAPSKKEEASSTTSSTKAEDILAMIRNRQK